MNDCDPRRKEATVLDHVIFDQETCIYCSAAIDWRFGRTGRTGHLDHFIPIEIIARARRGWPRQRFGNWLLPCCPTCNNLLGQYLFSTLRDRVDFVQWRLGRSVRGLCAQHPLASLPAPEALQSIIRPMTEFRYGRDYIVVTPRRLFSGDCSIEQHLAERALICCSPINPVAFTMVS
jgi:hypothetical protein